MLLFQKRFHEGIVHGAVRLTFRHWQKPLVKIGGRYRVHPIGVVEVDDVKQVAVRSISAKDAQACGFASRAELFEYMGQAAKAPLLPTTQVYRVAFRHDGDGDRVPLALDTVFTQTQLEKLVAQLSRLDGDAPWTMGVLRLIAKKPRIAASQLALEWGQEKEAFKVNVRKLKKLGLTQSFEVGYEISPRGEVFLARVSAEAIR